MYSKVIGVNINRGQSKYLFLALVILLACSDVTTQNPTDKAEASLGLLAVDPIELGIDFVHYNGMTGDLHLPEIMGSGGALFDYDLDGDLDLLLIQGDRINPDIPYSESTFLPSDTTDLGHRFYRNELAESGSLNFSDISIEAGFKEKSYGMGAVVGDLNGDSYSDIIVTGFGSNQVYLNSTTGQFTRPENVVFSKTKTWTAAGSIADFNSDGISDIYFGNYLDYSVAEDKSCLNLSGQEDYCGPISFEPQSDVIAFSRNGKDSYFGEGSVVQLPIKRPTLGTIVKQIDDEHGIYIANDSYGNSFWAVTAEEPSDLAAIKGIELNEQGQKEGSMGVCVTDLNDDLIEDILVTNWKEETNTLYLSLKGGYYRDATTEFGLALPSLSYTGFGCSFLDYDLDGDMDLVVANGSIKHLFGEHPESHPYPLSEQNIVFEQNDGRFARRQLSNSFGQNGVSRGLITGDVDNDGDKDIIITNNSGRPEVYLSNASDSKSWYGLIVVNSNQSIDLGARIEIEFENGEIYLGVQRRDGSYQSSNDPRLVFASRSGIRSGRIIWSDGLQTSILPTQLNENRYNVIERPNDE